MKVGDYSSNVHFPRRRLSIMDHNVIQSYNTINHPKYQEIEEIGVVRYCSKPKIKSQLLREKTIAEKYRLGYSNKKREIDKKNY